MMAAAVRESTRTLFSLLKSKGIHGFQKAGGFIVFHSRAAAHLAPTMDKPLRLWEDGAFDMLQNR